MRRTVLILAVMAAVFSGAAVPEAADTLTGTLVDNACYAAAGSKATGSDHMNCAMTCAQKGSRVTWVVLNMLVQKNKGAIKIAPIECVLGLIQLFWSCEAMEEKKIDEQAHCGQHDRRVQDASRPVIYSFETSNMELPVIPLRISLPILTIVAATSACTQMPYSIDTHVNSTPQTVSWGHLPGGRQPVARVRPGQTVSIDTVSHQGVNNGMDPLKFFAAGGVSANEVLADALDIYHKADHPKDSGAHVLTGPIYVETAEPGDMLEVRMVDFKFRVPYGVNNSAKGTGVLPDVHTAAYPKIIRFDLQRRVALFAPAGITIPAVTGLPP